MSILKYKNPTTGAWEKVGIPSATDVIAEVMDEVDAKIAAIPTPDVSGQINTHNSDANAHEALRTAINAAAQAAQNAQSTADGKEASGTAASAVSAHNADANAHADIRQAIANINPVPFTVAASAPSNTSIFWIDSANGNALKFYDGSAWQPVGSIWG